MCFKIFISFLVLALNAVTIELNSGETISLPQDIVDKITLVSDLLDCDEGASMISLKDMDGLVTDQGFKDFVSLLEFGSDKSKTVEYLKDLPENQLKELAFTVQYLGSADAESKLISYLLANRERFFLIIDEPNLRDLNCKILCIACRNYKDHPVANTIYHNLITNFSGRSLNLDCTFGEFNKILCSFNTDLEVSGLEDGKIVQYSLDLKALKAVYSYIPAENILSLSSGAFRRLDMHSLRNISTVSLHLMKNLISLKVSNLECLESLAINDCDNLEKVSLDGLPDLKELDLKSNRKLIETDVSSLYSPKLEKISAKYSPIKDLAFVGFPVLKEIDLSFNNGAVSLLLSYLDKLKKVDVSNCRDLENVDLANLPSLEEVNLSDNPKLENLCLFDMPDMRTISGRNKTLFLMSESRYKDVGE